MPACLQDIQEPDDIAVDIGPRILERVAHPSLGRQMNYPGKALAEQVGHCRRVGNIDAMETEAAMRLQILQPRVLEYWIVLVVQIVAADDLVPLLQQVEADVHADEPGGTGDENFQATHLEGTTTNARLVQGQSGFSPAQTAPARRPNPANAPASHTHVTAIVFSPASRHACT